MKKKLKIYFCDFVHNYLGAGTSMFPLNIGYISTYAKKYAPQELDIKLFKYPETFIQAFKKNGADIVGFANYTWNLDINKTMSRRVKEISPRTLTIFGGPNIDYTPEGYNRFFLTHRHADFYIPFQGERPFLNFLEAINEKGSGLDDIKTSPINGVLFYDWSMKTYVMGKDTPPRIRELDEIPSPYLEGLLDEFFDTNLIPIIETNRGCPYRCTFCAQGISSYNHLDFFSMERVKAELKYVAHRVKNTNILNLADANFGVVARDMDIARYIAQLTEETQRFKKFNTNWAKNQPKLFEIAKILNSSNIIVSLQSLDDHVLANVKRTNIKIPIFKDIMDRVNEIGGMSGTEIILGLPGETKVSHIKTLKSLFDWDASCIICYNALLLEGTEMSIMRDKGQLNCTTKFRLIDSSFGKYDNIMSFEAEEGIRSTPEMTEEEVLYFRPVHWLIQFLWNYRFYYDALKYLKFLGVHPLDYILNLLEEDDRDSSKQKVQMIFREFKEEARAEWFDTPEALQAHYRQPEKFKELEDGKFGKMNGKYIFKTYLEAMEDFNEFLLSMAVSQSPVCRSKRAILEDLFKFHAAAVLNLTDDWEVASKEKIITFKYDILGWRNVRYKGDLEQFYHPEGIEYRYSLPEKQKQGIEMLLKQYAHKNKNVTLRKMTECMNIRDLFYSIEQVGKLVNQLN